jgi:hypothetical protein
MPVKCLSRQQSDRSEHDLDHGFCGLKGAESPCWLYFVRDSAGPKLSQFQANLSFAGDIIEIWNPPITKPTSLLLWHS